MRTSLGAIAVLTAVLLWPAQPAQAHPVDKFSVNQYAGLTLHPDRIEVTAAIDVAEIPTLQEKPLVDTDGDMALSPAERATHATAECARLAGALTATAGGEQLTWTVTAPGYQLLPGSGGLPISRLDCRLTAPAELTGATTVRVDNGYRTDRVGWREMTANGAGVSLSDSALPTASVTDELRTYPTDLLSSPPDVRSATIGVGGATGAAAVTGDGATLSAGPEWLAAAQSKVESTLGGRLTPLVVGLAFLLALLLGAGHAVLPGHGKTIMAAYFAGKHGRARDALTVGGTVTLAHTGTVLLLGLVLSTSTALAGERALSLLGVISGLLVVAVGATMLLAALRSRRSGTHSHSHTHHGHGHTHDGHAHGHDHSHKPHDPAAEKRGRVRRWLGLAGVGLAGGLVPSPSALVVLLGAIGLGRAGLGIALVFAYGLGMAATLTAIGLLLVVAQNRLSHLTTKDGRWATLSRLGARFAASAPTATAALVVIVGLGIGLRAAV